MTDSNFPKIFVIILNYNGSDTLSACLGSVFQSDYPNFEMVVVDNDSKDGSFEQAKLNFSRSHFIKNSENIGFGRGNNVGIRFALEKFADYVFILNNDTIIEKNTLSSLINAVAEMPTAGVASPLIMNGDNKSVWFAGGIVNWFKMRTEHIFTPISQKPYQSEYITGCAMLVRKDVFKKIGLFDERFFLYYEDADFSLRAKKAGFELLMIPASKIQHLEQSNKTNGLKTYWLVLSGLIFFNTHASFMQKIWLFIYLLLRKTKNFFDYNFSSSEIARNVNKAYRDYRKISK